MMMVMSMVVVMEALGQMLELPIRNFHDVILALANQSDLFRESHIRTSSGSRTFGSARLANTIQNIWGQTRLMYPTWPR